MTDEERSRQSKTVYSLKMWDVALIHSTEGEAIKYCRVPGGWIINSSFFIPIGKEKVENYFPQNKTINI